MYNIRLWNFFSVSKIHANSILFAEVFKRFPCDTLAMVPANCSGGIRIFHRETCLVPKSPLNLKNNSAKQKMGFRRLSGAGSEGRGPGCNGPEGAEGTLNVKPEPLAEINDIPGSRQCCNPAVHFVGTLVLSSYPLPPLSHLIGWVPRYKVFYGAFSALLCWVTALQRISQFKLASAERRAWEPSYLTTVVNICSERDNV